MVLCVASNPGRYANLNQLLLLDLNTITTYLKVHNICDEPSAVSPKILDVLGLSSIGFCISLKWKDVNPIIKL
jgi:hypothetical protein